MSNLQIAALLGATVLAVGVHAQYGWDARGARYAGHSAQALAAHITALTDAQFGGGYPQSRRVLAWSLAPITAHDLGWPRDTVRGLSQAKWRERSAGKRRTKPTSHYVPSMRRVWGAVARGDLDDAYKRVARLASKSHRHTEIEAITTHEVLLELGDMELERGAHDRAVRSYRTAVGMFADVASERTVLAFNRLIAAGFRGGDHADAMAHVSALAHLEAVVGTGIQERSSPTRAAVDSYPLFAGLPQHAH